MQVLFQPPGTEAIAIRVEAVAIDVLFRGTLLYV